MTGARARCRSVRRWPAALLCVAGVACAPRFSLDESSPFDEDDPAAFADDSAPGEPAVTRAAPDPCPRDPTRERRRTIPVAQAELQRVLDAGPGPILRGLEIKPHIVEQRFIGWEIVRFMPCETRFDDLDLRPGDVVGRINQRQIIRPEHLADVWAELRTARVITVEVASARGDFVLRFEVSEYAKPAAP